MKNIEYIKKIEDERAAVSKVLFDADRVVLDIICDNCKNNRYCSHKRHNPVTVEQVLFCVGGTIEWFYKEWKND